MSQPTYPAPSSPDAVAATVPSQSHPVEPSSLDRSPTEPPIVPLPFSEPYVLATIRATPGKLPPIPPDPGRGHVTRGYTARHAAPPRAGAGSSPGLQGHLPDQDRLGDRIEYRDDRVHREPNHPQDRIRPQAQTTIQIPHQTPGEVRSPSSPGRLPAYGSPARPTYGAVEPADPHRRPLFTMTPEPEPTKRRWILGAAGLTIVLVLVCIGAALVVGFGAKSVTDTIRNDEVAAGTDVAITGCAINKSTHRMVADVTITNRGHDTASYVVDIGFANADGTEQFDSGVATADGLPAGRTTTVFATASAAAPAAFTCSVTGATRF